MNSEELELSLRTEFENYLKSFRAEMREQSAELHKKLEAEIDKHRSQLDEAFQAFAARFDSEQPLDAGFKASVVEHLRQARDEGAALTAAAMDEASHLDQATAAPADFKGIRDAINDISQHRSQSAILQSLVDNAAAFAPRGAFFIVKNDHLVGWKAFGAGSDDSDAVIRDIRFPLSADSILCDSVRSLTTADGSYGAHDEDKSFLEPLHFGQPDRMHAIPLVARGRGVAVLYADYGSSGTNVNVEGLEAIVRIAGMTVELLANAQTAKAEERQSEEASFEQVPTESVQEAPTFEEVREESVEAAPVETVQEIHEPSPVEESQTDFAFTESTPDETVQEESPFAEPVETVSEIQSPAEEAASFEHVSDEAESDQAGEVIFDAGESLAGEPSEAAPFDKAADLEPATAGIGGSLKKETAVEISPANVGRVKSRGERTVDLPIEVSESERRPHNDARRFARLLVSEIKLYNEQRVQEGRQAGDLYQRLREAIDRSREMYDKRVQPPVAAKFDYFHHELVNSLADGNADRLGSGYPGASV